MQWHILARTLRFKEKLWHPHVASLRAECPGESSEHVHLPYAIRFDGHRCNFDTAIESEYPELLCKRIAQCLKSAFAERCTFKTPTNTALSGVKQTKKHAPLIPEFHHIAKSKPADKPCKFLTSPVSGGDDGESSRYGVYHSPQQFIKLAQNLVHPFDKQFVIPDILRLNIFNLIAKGIGFVADVRTKSANLINMLSQELRFEGARYHASLPQHAQIVLKGENILLFKKLLEDNGFEDISAVDMMAGVQLVGTPEKSPLFESKFVPATTTSDYLLASSTWLRKKIQARDVHADDPELSKTLWETSLSEVDLGFLEGPFDSVGEVQKIVDHDTFVCRRRFDDLRESCINEAFTIVDRLCLHDIDFVASMLAFLAGMVSNADGVSMELQDGRVLSGRLQKDFVSEQKWYGKCLDLAKAYKQIPVSACSRRFGVLMVYSVTRSLPFGARASVYAFNRLSRGLWFLMAKLCHVILGCFYDDFPIVEPCVSAVLATQSVQHLLKALGWLYAKDPSKDKPFTEEFDMLGVCINTSNLHLGVFTLANKPSRVDKVLELINDIKKCGNVDKKNTQVVHGLLNFMASFVMGHSVRLACRVFASAIAAGNRWSRKQVCRDFTWDCLWNLRGRSVDGRGERRPVLIFTDAAFKDGVCTYGVVVIDQVSSKREVFGGEFRNISLISGCSGDHRWLLRQKLLQCWSLELFVGLYCITVESFSSLIMSRAVFVHQDLEWLAISDAYHSAVSSEFWDWPCNHVGWAGAQRFRGLQHQAATMILGTVVDPPLDLEAAATMCEDLSSLPSFAVGGEDPSYDILRELPDTSFFDE